MNTVRSQRGMTLLEVLVVVIIAAMLTYAVAQLVRTTWISWITADRRAEIVGSGRVGMSKLVTEIRIAHDLYSATDPTYIDYYPQWATSTIYRFNYNTAAFDFQYGVATPAFSPDSLVYPMDSFSYLSYTRKLDTGVTRARRINAFKFVDGVSDERRLLPAYRDALNPIYFRSGAQLRMAREGYMISRDNTFATDTFHYHIATQDQICIKAFCDRVDPWNMNTRTAGLAAGLGSSANLTLIYNATGDYFATCCNLGVAPCILFLDLTTDVTITLADTLGEWTQILDTIQIH